jgi:SNF2 family DNA or RNA helicase
MVRDIPAFWNWADGNTKPGASGWFHISTKRNRRGDILSEYVIEGQLQACVDSNCINGRVQSDGSIGPVTDEDCEHWAKFRALEQEPWMLARPESLLDLPPMSGADTPLLTPMKPGQKSLYNKLKKDYIASLPESGIDIESLSTSQRFIHLWQLSTGVSSVGEGDQDLDDKQSGKLALTAEMVDDRSSPTLLGCYFRNTARSLVRLCERLGKSYVTFGASTTPKGRKEAVRGFQEGSFDVMIGSIPVVGEGLTLTAADGVYLVERMWTPDKNTQLIRRVQRRGQQRSVGVRQLVTPDSVDQGQWEALKDKKARVNRVDVARLLDGKLEYLA